MTVQSFTTAQAASQLSVSESTARRLYDEYTDPTTRLPRGRKGERQLTVNDIETIREVLRLKGDNPRLTSDEIKEQVKNIIPPAPIVEASQNAQANPGAAQTALIVVEAMQSVVAPLESRLQRMEERMEEQAEDQAEERFNLKERLSAMESRLRPIEAQRLRVDAAWLIVAAFIAGLIVGLAVWWFQ